VQPCIKPIEINNASPRGFKGIVHPKMKIQSVITHPHVVPGKTFVHLQNEKERMSEFIFGSSVIGF